MNRTRLVLQFVSLVPLPRLAFAAVLATAVYGHSACGQEIAGPGAAVDPTQALADAALQPPAAEPEAEPATSSVPLLEMAYRSRWLLAPIALLSVVVVAIAFERTLGLRRGRVAPRRLLRRLRDQATIGDLDPTLSRATCERYPSAAATVVTAMLDRVGRPHNEVESAAADEIDRQADRLYANVRTLNLAAAVAPLMGLLGTVWGMIQAFFVTASLPIESNKGQALADGIYVALFTTFAGLAVAIPAAVLAHVFEGRILGLMRHVEQLVAELLPHLERFEGSRRPLNGTGLGAAGPTVRADDAWAGPAGDHLAATRSPATGS